MARYGEHAQLAKKSWGNHGLSDFPMSLWGSLLAAYGACLGMQGGALWVQARTSDASNLHVLL